MVIISWIPCFLFYSSFPFTCGFRRSYNIRWVRRMSILSLLDYELCWWSVFICQKPPYNNTNTTLPFIVCIVSLCSLHLVCLNIFILMYLNISNVHKLQWILASLPNSYPWSINPTWNRETSCKRISNLAHHAHACRNGIFNPLKSKSAIPYQMRISPCPATPQIGRDWKLKRH